MTQESSKSIRKRNNALRLPCNCRRGLVPGSLIGTPTRSGPQGYGKFSTPAFRYLYITPSRGLRRRFLCPADAARL
ncbi:hypothetical protein K439DRAFT_1637374 [Ramaria rubella]|nr:hypothetical protein K439DRAFT_1640675 [Ramaria rubella]KAF8580033.1 hypothetical protein K439DRAFT_1637374 [Ramaria rubella]